jgi:FMN phosphatase YigB (HAD superfamily)
MRNILDASSGDNTDYRYDGQYPFIEFQPGPIKRSYEENHEAYSINLRDYLGEYDCKEYDTHTSFVTKDHATFDGIIDYVKRSGAKKIIVENTRTKQGKKLAKKLNEINGVEAVCRPEKQ